MGWFRSQNARVKIALAGKSKCGREEKCWHSYERQL
jgi:hypothetical protein